MSPNRGWPLSFKIILLTVTLVSVISIAVTFNLYLNQNNQTCIVLNRCTYVNNRDTTSNNTGQVTSASTLITAYISYPRLTSVYLGTVHNTTYRDTNTLTLASIVQNNEQIRGRVIVADGSHASGPFTGVIGGDRSISFTEAPTDGSSALTFSGTVNPDGSMNGTYIYPGYGGGTWQVSPS